MSAVGEDLRAAIEKHFTSLLSEDKMATGLMDAIKNGTATFEEAEQYAARVGELLSKAITAECDKVIMPDDRLTKELVEEFLKPLLKQGHENVTGAAAETMEALNRAAGLNMKAVRPSINADRVDGLIEKAASYDTYNEAKWVFDDPVINFVQNICDKLLEENVDTHFNLGLSPKITRKAVGKCCKWCSNLEGEYNYPVEREVYRRHENCRCLVLYDPGDGKVQNAHTKKVYEDAKTAERDSRIERTKQIEQQKNAMYHRRIGERNKEIIDQPTYNKLTRDVLRTGGDIRRGGEEAKMLGPNDGAAYFRGDRLIVFRDDATISEVLEETYHDLQERKGMFLDYPNEEVEYLREIDAAKYVMSLQHRYKIPEIEMEELRENLRKNEEKLEQFRRERYES